MAVIQKPTPPPMRDLFQDKSGGASGIAPSWYKWLIQVFNTLIAQIDAIVGLTIINATQAQLAALSVGLPAGQFVYVTDFGHLLVWNGLAYEWGAGDDGSGYIQPFLVDPTGVGWKLCDGSAVNYLKQDGSIGNVALPDYTVPAYLKLATALVAGPSAAGGVTGATSGGTPSGTFTGAVDTTGNNSANVEVMAGVGTFVAADPHTHDVTPTGTFAGDPLADHTHGPGSLELERTQLKAWFRQ